MYQVESNFDMKLFMTDVLIQPHLEYCAPTKSVILSLLIVAGAPVFSFEMSEIGIANLVQFLGSFPL